jgi:hypothetical protein
MRISRIKTLLSCGLLLLCSVSFYAQESGQKKIVIIFKGSSKSPVAPISLDGQDKGELNNEAYIEIPVKEGSHDLTVGKQVTHNFTCYLESMSSGGGCTSGGPQNDLTLTFMPVTIKVDMSKNEKSYLLVEPYKPEGCCSQVNRMKLVDYKVREIKAKDAEKLTSKYTPMK